MQDETEHIVSSDKGFHTLSSEGVTPGFPKTYRFSWIHPKTGQEVIKSAYAIGPRNLEFRRAEAEKSGYIFKVHDEES
jgi:hypothetical protein